MILGAGQMMDRVTAVVLAGGGSSRMGTNKALLKLGNKTMIERVVEPLKNIFNSIIIVTNDPEEYTILKGVRFVKDHVDIEEKNSLIGLYSGLRESETSHIFVMACDMPFVNLGLIKFMINSLRSEDVIVPFVGGHYQPLHAIYGKGCIPEFESLLEMGWYKIANVFKVVSMKEIMEDDIKKFDFNMLCFENINTYEEYLQIKDKFN